MHDKYEPTLTPKEKPAEQLSEKEIENLRKKGRLVFRPVVDKKGFCQTSDGQAYKVNPDGSWRSPKKRVRMSKKKRMKLRAAVREQQAKSKLKNQENQTGEKNE